MSASNGRLILFDIDGTLISTGGRAGRAIADALECTFGIAPPFENYLFAGKTDPRIVFELMELVGLQRAAVEPRLGEVFRTYLKLLPAVVTPAVVSVLPGVTELLDALAARADVTAGLLTGNVAGGAEIKLRAAGLWERFGVGAFGSDGEDRNELVAVARRRARVRYGVGFPGRATVIVGDAEADVQCARAGGARAVAVASGWSAREQLAAQNPDALLDSLAEPGALEAILGSE